jgi:hypothetical protein
MELTSCHVETLPEAREPSPSAILFPLTTRLLDTNSQLLHSTTLPQKTQSTLASRLFSCDLMDRVSHHTSRCVSLLHSISPLSQVTQDARSATPANHFQPESQPRKSGPTPVSNPVLIGTHGRNESLYQILCVKSTRQVMGA